MRFLEMFATGRSAVPDMPLTCKLSRWFVVPTPLGDYNPDWAVVTKNDRKLYLVREIRASMTVTGGGKRKTVR
jgi:type III restriction enzyme